MIDPLRAWAPESLQARTADLANTLHLSALPLHLHEVLLALSFYACVAHVLSPILSARIVPDIYAKLDRSGRINWGVHIVSFVQSIIVNALSLYIIFCDDERAAWRPDDQWPMRIWGYHGLSGLLQSLALGYFLFDLYMCIRHVGIFGWGMVVHALASSSMFILGFRPFIHFYCPVFLIHELSSPFLNIHWFCDKLGLTGSVYQAVNGVILMTTFFGSRLVWGTYGAFHVSKDVYRATFEGCGLVEDMQSGAFYWASPKSLPDLDVEATSILEFRRLSVWIGVLYVSANSALTVLNVFWFSKMVQALRKRFDPPLGTKGIGSDRGARLKDE